MKIEEEFDITITDGDAENIYTLAELRDVVLRLRQHKFQELDDPDHIWCRVQMIVQEQSGMEIEKLVPSARIVDDLGMD